MVMRNANINKVLFGNKKEFVYYSPGAVRIAEKASAPVKGRSHTIETTIDLKGDEEGVIVACGGMTGGYTMYIRDGLLHYDYNFLDGVHHHLTSQPLPTGKVDLKFTFELDKDKIPPGQIMPWPGTGSLFVNGEKQDEVYFPTTHISTYSLAETFDVGKDTGTQVDPTYEGDPYPFTGTLDKVVFTMND